jgi:hypothetical protein
MISMFWQWIESRRRIPYKVALLLFGLGLCQPQNAQAQWTVPDSNQNIHNTNTGNVGIGITNPIATLHVLAPTSAVGVYVDTYGSQPILRFRRANGTAGNQPVNLGDTLGNLAFSGFGTSAYSNFASSRITAVASENWTDQAQGSSLGLYTTPSGSPAGPILRMNVDPFGNVAVGPPSSGAPTPVLLDLNGGFFHTTFNSGWVGILPPLNNQGGLTVGWNRSNSAAEVNFYNVFTGGTIVTAFQFSKMVNATTVQDLMTIQGNGNVGIGTTNPTSLLHVAGTLTANSTISGSSLTATATSGTAISAQALITSSATGNAITAPNGTISAMNIVSSGSTLICIKSWPIVARRVAPRLRATRSTQRPRHSPTIRPCNSSRL